MTPHISAVSYADDVAEVYVFMYVSSKEPYVSSKEPYVSTKEPKSLSYADDVAEEGIY